MYVTVIVVAAAGLQCLAAVLALRVLRVTGRSAAWLLIAAVTVVMALRRCIALYNVLHGGDGYSPDALYETLALIVSAMMAAGVARIGPYFIAIRRSEHDLRASEERYRRLVEQAPDGLFVHDGQRLLYVNPAGAKMLASESPGDLVGRPILELIHPDYHAIARQRVEAAVKRGAAAPLIEQRWVRRDQKVIDVEVASTPCIYGGSAAVQTIARDVGERHRIESERAALREQLHQAQKMEAVGQLSCGMAHDFSNLATVVLGHVETARERLATNRPMHEELATIEQAARQARGLTETLLRFGGKLPARKDRVDLASVVREAGQLLRRTLPASISTTVAAPESQPVWVDADPTQLQQVLLNLAINARDAMPDGGHLEIVVAIEETPPALVATDDGESAGPCARLTVADTGVGMSPEVQSRIFDPFFTTKPRGDGTGLGLSIVHAIVKAHNGAISVVSQPGVGSTFTVRLPLANTNAATLAPLAEKQVVTTGHGELILVAEDHQLVRELIVSALQRLGYHVLAAADEVEFLRAYRERAAEVRLFVVDVYLGRRTGPDCLREIRAAGGDAPAIVITGRPDATLESGLEGETAVLYKPFDIRSLGALVQSLLAGVSAEDDPDEPTDRFAG